MTMRKMLFAVVATMVALVGNVSPSAARPWYPWCAQYADRTGITECAFATFEQCRATVSGIGGNCIQNWYPAPAEPPRRDRRWRPFYH
jgi:hypothetical protein